MWAKLNTVAQETVSQKALRPVLKRWGWGRSGYAILVMSTWNGAFISVEGCCQPWRTGILVNGSSAFPSWEDLYKKFLLKISNYHRASSVSFPEHGVPHPDLHPEFLSESIYCRSMTSSPGENWTVGNILYFAIPSLSVLTSTWVWETFRDQFVHWRQSI